MVVIEFGVDRGVLGDSFEDGVIFDELLGLDGLFGAVLGGGDSGEFRPRGEGLVGMVLFPSFDELGVGFDFGVSSFWVGSSFFHFVGGPEAMEAAVDEEGGDAVRFSLTHDVVRDVCFGATGHADVIDDDVGFFGEVGAGGELFFDFVVTAGHDGEIPVLGCGHFDEGFFLWSVFMPFSWFVGDVEDFGWSVGLFICFRSVAVLGGDVLSREAEEGGACSEESEGEGEGPFFTRWCHDV